MNLIDLETFVVVAELGTITAAANKMNLPKSTISRRIKKLEEELEISLLHRTSRKTRITNDGQILYQRVASALGEIYDTERLIRGRRTEPLGTLRITTTYSYGRTASFVKCVASFKEKYPKVQPEILLNDEVSHLEDSNIDVAFRLYTDNIPGSANLMTRHLHSISVGLYASPEYLSAMGQVKEAKTLCEHRFISYSKVAFHKNEWMNKESGQKEQISFPKPYITVNDRYTLIAFALSSTGFVVADERTVEKHVHQGNLIQILPHYRQEIAKVSIVWVDNKHMSPKVRAFIDHAVEYLR